MQHVGRKKHVYLKPLNPRYYLFKKVIYIIITAYSFQVALERNI
jgi:hypothetical protein